MEYSPMLMRLDAVTQPHHKRADAPWVGLLAADVRRDDYIRQLVVTYGFEAPVEGALSYTNGLRSLVALRERVRSGLLAQDLLALGHTPAEVTELPQCFSITSFEDVAEALGWLYVVERATLHHETVRRNICQRVPTVRRATSYLASSGTIAGARWQALGMVIDEAAVNDVIAERITMAAEQAYHCLHEWNDTHQTQLRSAG